MAGPVYVNVTIGATMLRPCDSCGSTTYDCGYLSPARVGDYGGPRTLLCKGCNHVRENVIAWGTLTDQERELVQARGFVYLYPDDLARPKLLPVPRLLMRALGAAAHVDTDLRPTCHKCGGDGRYMIGPHGSGGCWTCGSTGKRFRPIKTHFKRYLNVLVTRGLKAMAKEGDTA